MADDEQWAPTEEQQRRIEQARAARARRLAVPADDRIVVDNPSKFGYPIGLDSDGNPFPLSERDDDGDEDGDAPPASR